MEAVPSAGRDQLRTIQRPARLRLSRLLQPRGLPHSSQEFHAVTTIPSAMKTGNLTIFDRAHVTRIGVDANGRASGVTYLKGGKEYFQPAAVVLIASYTYENTRLLLLSKSKAFPKG